jgi:fermentation-respiration switch protein FrsA (DUF1100 family)
VSLLGLLYHFQESFVYFPMKRYIFEWHREDVAVEDAWFTASDGTKLHGWFVPSNPSRGVLLFAHGNAGNVSDRIEKIESLHDDVKLDVLILDYRGYGKSEGTPSEKGLIDDTESALTWLSKRTGKPTEEIFLYGESIGGGVMVDLASRIPVKGLILESTFTSLPDVAAIHFPIVPVRLLMRSRFDSAAKIANVRAPLLQMHGDRDRIIPWKIGHDLFLKAPSPKKFVTIEGHDHNDGFSTRWIDEIHQFAGPGWTPVPSKEE